MVYKAFTHKLQRIIRHTPFRSAEPQSSTLTSQCAYVCESEHLSIWDLSLSIPSASTEKRKQRRKNKKRCCKMRVGRGKERQIEWLLLTNTEGEKEPESRVLAFSQPVPPYSFCVESWLRKDLSGWERKERDKKKYRNAQLENVRARRKGTK